MQIILQHSADRALVDGPAVDHHRVAGLTEGIGKQLTAAFDPRVPHQPVDGHGRDTGFYEHRTDAAGANRVREPDNVRL